MIDAHLLLQIPPPLLQWYDRCKRALPWRDHPNPYWVWISEIMLQQTRVEAVRPYFERFVATLPDIASLALAPPDQLYKLWEGLGYYSRARNLQKAAQVVMDDFGGAIPGNYQQLLRLPGIGPYTAGAIGSIAFKLPEPAVDGNVLRVISRLCADDSDIGTEKVRQAVREAICGCIPTDRPGDFNQSLMELGATVCLPGANPRCDSCPLAVLCRAHQNGIAGTLPVKAPKKQRRIEEKTVLALVSRKDAALRKREGTGLLAGLWELPWLDGHAGQDAVKKWLAARDIQASDILPLPPAKHLFTHIEWRMTGYLVEVKQPSATDELVWATLAQLEGQYSIPSAFKAYSAALIRRLEEQEDAR